MPFLDHTRAQANFRLASMGSCAPECPTSLHSVHHLDEPWRSQQKATVQAAPNCDNAKVSASIAIRHRACGGCACAHSLCCAVLCLTPVKQVRGMKKSLSASAWFAFTGQAGRHMATTFSRLRLSNRFGVARCCGTDWSSWLATPHPTEGSISNGTVCFSSRDDVCARTLRVHVCACRYSGRLWYTYRLPAVPFCFLGCAMSCPCDPCPCSSRTPGSSTARAAQAASTPLIPPADIADHAVPCQCAE